MDTRHFFATLALGCAASATLTGCTSEEGEMASATSNDEIRFNVRSMPALRNAQSNANNVPSSISLHAWHRKEGYNHPSKWTSAEMNLDGTWTYYTGSNRHWPESGTLDVVAFCSASGSFNDEATHPAIEGYTIHDNNEDLTYAVAQASKTNGKDIDLDFKSALCDVDFVTTTGEGNLEVEVHSITIGNISTVATFLFPAAGTMTGSWTDLNVADSEMTACADEYGNASLRMIPQRRKAWRPGAGKGGTYLKVNCTVRSRCADGNTLIPLYDGDTYMSIEADWRPGKRYIHVLDFSGCNIGYTSLSGDIPTLDIITIQNSIDSFVAD